MKKYNTEMEGQIDFYKKYLKRINKELTQEDVISDNTDGVLNGNLIEFKLNINDVNSVLFQSIKYLSSMRIRGKSIPSNIVLISLNKLSKIILFKDILLSLLKEILLSAINFE